MTCLSLFQDVSDRVDKEDMDSALLHSLERQRFSIVGGNWHDVLNDAVRDDLRKHRSYNPKSVRDLLRALRNKRHHYNELPDAIKALYGRVPDQFADYWTARFPRLLVHSWHVMHSVKNEPTFTQYFDKNYDFLPVRKQKRQFFFFANDMHARNSLNYFC
jgi:serine/threonine-protein kinase/endoribonuclease IRE1